ncbi:BZ3500_MvSof-1268-A1-R1_Chr11-2g03337 [Microbotryum saponariae]|uniref:BZ3500_MvSof-1268-A1-R1_Chr11-2g03337 protein n=1 Tax=Microbotryum saponariae TaxID=289078 RepID=A0A2X0L8N8_9BASI|nr:BZ3500_MvSof-1268-A1-R1_Chr11-2g03337 [Microbotryum saponariae]SDA03154.1 BZ3501_MvSof-1269-A2-R1_Chr11g02908 [Microbotryum saponariae]
MCIGHGTALILTMIGDRTGRTLCTALRIEGCRTPSVKPIFGASTSVKAREGRREVVGPNTGEEKGWGSRDAGQAFE